ncbi:imidazole glycerol phosphate synthase subunit HisH [Halopolyspora algeriensis]|uniref:imidazole glycerol phosphate synthase subunit HisH n=1 Tax=Halopolyspora algeriensis TaxID=1500506 RepID=UPI000DF1C431|nr:imidazole glycerol phosphate synthase subunit HisH [Halopolyspora algeriensis]
MARVVVLDYGSGNLRSAERALERAGADVEVTSDRRAALEADGLVVPGVGAFSACMDGLRAAGGDGIVDRRLADERPTLGICVGMQILFERGVEHGVHAEGVGQWPGTVERLHAEVLPHMGWNEVSPPEGTTLFADMDPDTRFYFVHSFAVRKWETASSETSRAPLVTWGEHGEPFVAAVEHGALSATQFHPEKSGEAGTRLLRNWLGGL